MPAAKKVLPDCVKFGRDYDGWALRHDDNTRPPYWSHFVASPKCPEIPVGCVPIKITPLFITIVNKVAKVKEDFHVGTQQEEERADQN